MPPLVDGYWGKPTATIDWCEENYVYSYYIAEITNTITNVVIIFPPIWGILEVIKQGLNRRFAWCHLLILIVGLGSWAFHMTLLYEMQLFDELPMVWGTSVFVYCLAVVEKPGVKGKISNVPLFIFLTLFAVGFTTIYLLWPQPIFQHTSYGILVFANVVLDLRLLKIKGCPICKKLFLTSFIIFLFGFFLWNLDKLLCNDLSLLRLKIPGIFDPFTQLHGWWHLMTGYASYLQILFVIHASYDFNKKKQPKDLELRSCQYGFSLRWFKKNHKN